MGTAPRPSLTAHDMRRAAHVVHETIERLELDLRGLCVLTEGATAHYAVTAAIAVAAGADRVFAVTADSVHGTARQAIADTVAMVQHCGAREGVLDVTEPSPEVLAISDVITNLGFVRPLDARRVAALKDTAVIALMCEPWEVRPGDVDLDACGARGIVVLGTNEHSSMLPVFSYAGTLALRMLFEAGLEVRGTRVAILGRDPFAPEIATALRRAGARVRVDRRLQGASMHRAIRGAEAVLVADYASEDVIVGPSGLLPTHALVSGAPDAVVVQFAGAIDGEDLVRHEVRVFPWPTTGPRRMARTFAHLGVRPVIELHAAGLRVGAAAARLRLAGHSAAAAAREVVRQLPIALPVAAAHS